MNTQEKVRSIIEGATAQVLSMLTNTIGKTTGANGRSKIFTNKCVKLS